MMKLLNIINNIKSLIGTSSEKHSHDIDEDDIKMDIWLTYHRILQYLNIYFDGLEFEKTKLNDTLVLYNSIICLTIDSDKCTLAIGYDTNPVIAAKITLALADILGDALYVHDDPYFYDTDRNKLMWGYEEIDKHIKLHNKVKKILPIVVYDDKNSGNC